MKQLAVYFGLFLILLKNLAPNFGQLFSNFYIILIFQNLTGGVLLLRNKYYIVIYRGKDFLPTSVAVALIERQELAKDVQDLEEKVRTKELNPSDIGTDLEDEDTSMNNIRNAEIEASFSPNGHALAGTLAEFQEAQAQWGREVTVEEQEQMKQEVSRIKISKMVKRLEHKLSLVWVFGLKVVCLLVKCQTIAQNWKNKHSDGGLVDIWVCSDRI